jgi:hypothetical protein
LRALSSQFLCVERTDNVGRQMSWEPLFLNDPERFFDKVLGEDESSRLRAYGCAQDLLFGEIYRFGFFNRPEMVAPLARRYDELVAHGLSVDRRMEVYRLVVDVLTRTNSLSIGALVPFICHDADLGIVSTASIDFVSFGPLLDNDPMSQPKELIKLVDEATTRSPGAIFGGLLVLGDPRVCELLRPVRDRLSLVAAIEATQCTSGAIGAATIEFVLDWLEERSGTQKKALFGSLVCHLLLQRRHMQVGWVTTGLRPFPVASVSDEEFRTMGKWISFEEYRERVGPRMIALARREPEPKMMPTVLDAWGIVSPDDRG